MKASNAEKSLQRFTDTSQTLHHFSHYTLVHCPKCEKKAFVQTDSLTRKSELKCPECHHCEKQGKWYGQVDLLVRQRCDGCGKCIDKRVQESKVKYPCLLVTCASCKQEKAYKSLPEKVFPSSRLPADPIFGLKLWLQADFREYVLWAYNHQQLQYLKAYIGARLRKKTESAAGLLY